MGAARTALKRATGPKYNNHACTKFGRVAETAIKEARHKAVSPCAATNPAQAAVGHHIILHAFIRATKLLYLAQPPPAIVPSLIINYLIMKTSTKKTESVLIRFTSDSGQSEGYYVIVWATKEYINLLKKRLRIVMKCVEYAEPSLICLDFSEQAKTFISPEKGEMLLDEDLAWCYVDLTQKEIQDFERSRDMLLCHQMVIYCSGSAKFVAYEKFTGIEFETKKFSVSDFLKAWH